MKPDLPRIVKLENERIKQIVNTIPLVEESLRRLNPVSPEYDLGNRVRLELELEQLKLEYFERCGYIYDKRIEHKTHDFSR